MSCTQEVICDSICIVNAICNIVADSLVTNDALMKSQQLYNDSFVNMQNSFSCFVNMVIAIITILGLLIGFLSFLNFKNVKNSKKDLKDAKKKISDLEKNVGEQFELQKNKFEKFKEQHENKTEVLINIIENYKREQKEKNKKLPLEIDMELQKAIDTTFSDEQKKQTFTNDYIREIKRFRVDDPYTLGILERFRREKGTTDFIKYLEGFFEALSYWSEEKIYTWTLLSTKRKEAELSECMKHIDSGKLEEFQIKCARLQSVIPEKVFFLDLQNYIK